jgi:Ca2+-binding EF-hand superfamily protein
LVVVALPRHAPLERSTPPTPGLQLSREKVRGMVRAELRSAAPALFDQFDADLSGFLDDSEWSSVLAVLSAHASSRRQMTRAKVREMVRIQLELLGRNPKAASDEWVDSLFERFDVDGSGTIDDSEWDNLVAALPTHTLNG